MATVLDLASSFFGFLGGLILLISAWKGAPFRETIDAAELLDPKGVLFDIAQDDSRAAKAQLASIMAIERTRIIWGALCLCVSFAFALVKHAV